jgi:RNAse (barnase) inhibitor barstar
MNKKTVIINGDNFSNLEGFYDEIDCVLTNNLDWQTGHNLDAFNDLLRGGFGVHDYGEPIKLIWKNISKSKLDLGFVETKKWYESKIFDDKLKMITEQDGQTLFKIILEIISNQENIEFQTT